MAGHQRWWDRYSPEAGTARTVSRNPASTFEQQSMTQAFDHPHGVAATGYPGSSPPWSSRRIAISGCRGYRGDVDDSGVARTVVARHIPLTTIVPPDNRGRSVALNTGFGAAKDKSSSGVTMTSAGPRSWPGTSPPRRGPSRSDRSLPQRTRRHRYTRAQKSPRTTLPLQAFALPAQQRWRLWGANVSVRRDTWRDIGGYDTAYRAYGFEDVDWGYRLHRAGIP
jgi:hypothetical protein